MNGRNIQVTGGAGFIGSHTCKALSNAGLNRIVFNNLSTGNRKSVRRVPLAEGDILDIRSQSDAITKYESAAVVHFAGSADVGESVAEPKKRRHLDNFAGTLPLLTACRNAVVKRAVHTFGVVILLIASRITCI